MSDIHNDPSTPTPGGDADGTQPPLAIPAAIPLAKLAYAPLARQLFFPAISMRRIDAFIDTLAAAVVLAVFVPMLTMFGIVLTDELDTPLGPLLVNVPLGIFFLIFIALMLIIRNQSARHVGLTIPSTLRFWVMLPIAMVGIYAAAMIAGLIFVMIFTLAGMDEATLVEDKVALFDMLPSIPAWALIPFVMFVGLHEELLFRGFLLARLRTATQSNVIAIIVTSLVFGLLHIYQGPLGVFQTACIGAAMAIVTIHARTIWPAIIAHAFLDGVNMSLMPWLQEFLTKHMEQVSASQPSLLGG